MGNNDFVYTIKPDPITIDLVGMYALYYPYLDEYGVVHGNYWKHPDKLVNDTDVPNVPATDRLTLLKVAYWFFSNYLKEAPERTQMYKADAMEAVLKMAEAYDLGSEPTNLENEDILFPGFIQGPAGYPRFRNLT